MAVETPDPVPSPEPVTPSSPVTPPPEPSPAPEPEGNETPAPPAASDQPKRLPEDNRPEEEEVLARLQGIDTKKDKEEAPAAPEETPAATETPPTPAPKPDEFTPPDEAEMNSYHSKTRDRVKGIMRHLDGVKEELKVAQPYATYGKAVVDQARTLGVTNEQLNAWLETGFMLKKGDARALPALAAILKQAKFTDPALGPPAPPAPAAPDLSAIDAAIDALHTSLDLSPEGTLKLKSALKAVVATKAPAPPVAPVVTAPTPAPIPPQVAAQAQAIQAVNGRRNEYAKALKERWPDVENKIRAKVTEIEAGMTPAEINDHSQWTARFDIAASEVLRAPTHTTATPTPPAPPAKHPTLTPSLRAASPSTPRAKPQGPQSGTTEYEEGLLDGTIEARKR